MGVIAELCEKIAATNVDSLTPEAVTKARRLVPAITSLLT